MGGRDDSRTLLVLFLSVGNCEEEPINIIAEEAKHSAPYPPSLVRELLKGAVEEDYLVLDPFCGQATTGIVAAELNCKFIGYDISESFCRLGRRRLVEACPV